jgi:hypothetical protein
MFGSFRGGKPLAVHRTEFSVVPQSSFPHQSTERTDSILAQLEAAMGEWARAAADGQWNAKIMGNFKVQNLKRWQLCVS